jgi:hypothetical protein
MNLELQLKLQAWVDDELPDHERKQITAWISTDKEAQELVEELRLAKAVLQGNEPEVTLPESREFYWSKISRRIERLEQAPVAPRWITWGLGWRQLLAPLSGVALIVFLSVLSLNLFPRPDADESLKHLVEVENLSEYVGSISYKSQSENMFVVYLYNKDQEPETDADAEPLDDPVIQ